MLGDNRPDRGALTVSGHSTDMEDPDRFHQPAREGLLHMTPEDRFAVEDLLARYAWVLDTGDYETYPSLFTPDGVVAMPNGEWRGRGAIQEFVRDLITGSSNRGNRHHNTQILFEESGDNWCRLRSYSTHIYQPEPGGLGIIRSQGWYRDLCVKVDDVWYFAERRWGEWRPDDLQQHQL